MKSFIAPVDRKVIGQFCFGGRRVSRDGTAAAINTRDLFATVDRWRTAEHCARLKAEFARGIQNT